MFIEVEESLREISQREATWGSMLSNGPVPTSSSSSHQRSNGINSENGATGSINGRANVKGLIRGGGGGGSGGKNNGRGEGLLSGVGSSNGGGGASGLGGVGGSALTETRTLV